MGRTQQTKPLSSVAARAGHPARGAVAAERLRLLRGCAAGVEPAADPLERITVNEGSAPRAPGCWWRPGRRAVRWCVRGVAEPSYYSEAGKAGRRGKDGSRNAACETLQEVGRECARAVRGRAGRGTGTGMADQAAPLGRRGRGETLWRSLQPRLRSRDAPYRLGAGEAKPGVTHPRG